MTTKTIGTPPAFCPGCGAAIRVVRPVIATWFEVACEACERTFVISIDDHVAVHP